MVLEIQSQGLNPFELDYLTSVSDVWKMDLIKVSAFKVTVKVNDVGHIMSLAQYLQHSVSHQGMLLFL